MYSLATAKSVPLHPTFRARIMQHFSALCTEPSYCEELFIQLLDDRVIKCVWMQKAVCYVSFTTSLAITHRTHADKFKLLDNRLS